NPVAYWSASRRAPAPKRIGERSRARTGIAIKVRGIYRRRRRAKDPHSITPGWAALIGGCTSHNYALHGGALGADIGIYLSRSSWWWINIALGSRRGQRVNISIGNTAVDSASGTGSKYHTKATHEFAIYGVSSVEYLTLCVCREPKISASMCERPAE